MLLSKTWNRFCRYYASKMCASKGFIYFLLFNKLQMVLSCLYSYWYTLDVIKCSKLKWNHERNAGFSCDLSSSRLSLIARRSRSGTDIAIVFSSVAEQQHSWDYYRCRIERCSCQFRERIMLLPLPLDILELHKLIPGRLSISYTWIPSQFQNKL